MVKKFITNLDSSKASSFDCISVVVLKNCGSELSYKLADFFNMCLKESLFSRLGRLISCPSKDVGERATARGSRRKKRSMSKHYHLDSLLTVVSKVVEKLVNDRIVIT